MSTCGLLATATRLATLSPCSTFRYLLRRELPPTFDLDSRSVLLFIMLNPSTADADVDDPTIRRCAGFAVAHGCAVFEVVNLFAYRATKPADLARMGWQVGAENDMHIAAAAARANHVCVAWGAIGTSNAAERRVQLVMPLIRAAGHEPQCLQLTRSGFPQHPLRLPNSCRLHNFDLALQDWTP